MLTPYLIGDANSILSLQVDKDIGAVVVGWDPKFDDSKIVYASICLREIPGCLFIASNTDSADSLGPPIETTQSSNKAPGHNGVHYTNLSNNPAHGPSTTSSASNNGRSDDDRPSSSSPSSSSLPHNTKVLIPRMMPGTGSLVAAVSVASGIQPFVVGKEGPWLLGHLKQEFGVEPSLV
ncbi:hypothetical protein CEUSTIGMA_g11466.t1 [Chlamydomonas eustigma]|uniref:Uncharacterized protein n=1 Tax=Chlamydomonas eustigma TaxID=1157962 RepID=A0A250XMB5_9CHLO|nr:hypothetical protein CEUSTIGMA_g11466.t1 [Chlamydomonas eustigma]|eukprot:GAX84042.1 hypothetical protein CEUSTIGMA_g11466.t1 [Chlamydomonas eustigma]